VAYTGGIPAPVLDLILCPGMLFYAEEKFFVADLGTLEFSVPDARRDIRVECEFSVGA